MTDPTITDLEARRKRARIDKARDNESAAVQVEMHAAMWREAVAADPNIAQHAHEQLRNYETQAKKARSEANEMHKLAGTTPELFAPYVRRAYLDTLENFKQEYVKSKDAEEHPEAYGEFFVPSAVYAAGIPVAEKALAEVEKSKTAVTPAASTPAQAKA